MDRSKHIELNHPFVEKKSNYKDTVPKYKIITTSDGKTIFKRSIDGYTNSITVDSVLPDNPNSINKQNDYELGEISQPFKKYTRSNKSLWSSVNPIDSENSDLTRKSNFAKNSESIIKYKIDSSKYCMFCKKAGNPYDHPMRKSDDPNSEIICMFLKNIVCSHCGEQGHTKSYCDFYQGKKYVRDKLSNKYVYINQIESVSEKKVLSDSDELVQTETLHLSNHTDKIITDNVIKEENSKSNLIPESLNNKRVNMFCEFCNANGVPLNICQNHNIHDIVDDKVILSCPLYYFMKIANKSIIQEKLMDRSSDRSSDEQSTSIEEILSYNSIEDEDNESIFTKPRLSPEPFLKKVFTKSNTTDSIGKINSSIESTVSSISRNSEECDNFESNFSKKSDIEQDIEQIQVPMYRYITHIPITEQIYSSNEQFGYYKTESTTYFCPIPSPIPISQF